MALLWRLDQARPERVASARAAILLSDISRPLPLSSRRAILGCGPLPACAPLPTGQSIHRALTLLALRLISRRRTNTGKSPSRERAQQALNWSLRLLASRMQ